MKVVLGVCGGIAAYKAAELVRELQRRGAEVQVVMTAGAERFVAPLTFAALSGRQVLASLWEPEVGEVASGEVREFAIEHIRVAQEADVVVVAPATANVLAKMAHGIADDLLTTMLLATTAPVVVAPAMNVNMWLATATASNVDVLRGRGVLVVAPGSGELACGMVGEGRLAEVVEIADAVEAAVRERGGLADLAGETVLITAGGTREPIDAVRFIGNRSSGRMGVALAEAALARGAEVIFVAAAMEVRPPRGCEVVRVGTAAEMQRAVMQALPRASVMVMAAAVADYRVEEVAEQKLKKRERMALELVRNDDILRTAVERKRAGTVVVGFAAETERVVEEGRRKLREKGVDAMVANDVSRAGSGFEAESNAGVLMTREAEVELPLMSKREMAERILDVVRAQRERAMEAALV
ncbi:MAG: bifunctional phosphopantothenoylcysteine decarboxylase/phosphopantothenate--cysteine ligase CoaBC [Acidobacteriota bacterium]